MHSEHTAPLLEFRNISKQYPGVKAVDDVSFRIERGKVVALMGINGAGKSTLMKILSGAETRDAGGIYIDGKPLPLKYSTSDARDYGIGIIYQELSVLSELTVGENIFLTKEYLKCKFPPIIDYKKIYAASEEQLKKLDATNIRVKEKVGNLALPEKQVVEIAKALVLDCKILIMDEPTTSLTTEETMRLFDVIRSLKKQGVSIFYISHRMDEIFQICDQAIVMRDGKFIDEFQINEIDRNRLVEAMTGKPFRQREKAPASGPIQRKKLFEVKGATDRKFIHNVSFHVGENEVLGIGGLTGAKRTELARLIFGADPGFGGEVLLEGKPVHIRNPAEAIRHGIGYLSENRKEFGLNLGREIVENIVLTDFKSVSKRSVMNKPQMYRVFEKYAKDMGIKGKAETKAGALSGGNQQKVAIAKWLHAGCKLIIFDEPTRGVDVAAKAEIYRMIREYAAEGNGAIVISSEVEELAEVCDRVLIMSKGEITAELQSEEVDHDNILNHITSNVERQVNQDGTAKQPSFAGISN